MGVHVTGRRSSHANTALHVMSLIGLVHLAVHFGIRIHEYISPGSDSFTHIVNVYAPTCYTSPRFSSNVDHTTWNRFTRQLTRVHDETENHHVLLHNSTLYAAEDQPYRTLYSWERWVLPPLVARAVSQTPELSSSKTTLRGVVMENYPGSAGIYHVLVESGESLYRLTQSTVAERPLILSSHSLPETSEISIIVPYSDAAHRLSSFLDLILLLMREDLHFTVTLVNSVTSSVTSSEGSGSSGGEGETERVIREFKTRAGPVIAKRLVVLSLYDKSFSRGKARNYGATHTSCKNCTLFFCDLDMWFDTHMLNRCRALAIQGSSVYFPIVFSQYNPEMSGITLHPRTGLEIREESGSWRSYGFGMSCMHYTDFINSGKFPEYTSWGGEDDAFHSTMRKSNLQMFRVPDPGLFHGYHSKHCTSRSSKACFKSQAANEGTSDQVATKYFHMLHNIHTKSGRKRGERR